jgi:hypothetical protein
MHDTKNIDLVVLKEIHDAIVSEENFTKIFAVELGNDTANARILEEDFSRFNDAIDEGDGMKNGIASDERFDVLKIVPGGQRLADLRHRAILSVLPG